MTQTQYLDSKFLNWPNAKELLSSICESLINLREDKLLQLSMNGPAAKWKVLSKTLNIGSCSQHAVRGALKMGMKSVDWNV